MPPTSAQRALRHHAEELAAQLPPLLVDAERVAITVSQGVHGRRRVGQGETFWQFRQYEPGEPAQRIDWRESARSDRLYVRETEWEASESVWIWRDSSPSMDYASTASLPTKRARSDLLALDRKSTRLNSSHVEISYAVFCLKKKKKKNKKIKKKRKQKKSKK